MDSKIIKYILVIILICFKASAIEFNGKFIQGHFIIGKTDSNSKDQRLTRHKLEFQKMVILFLELVETGKYDLVIAIEKDGIKKKITKKVQKRKYNIQRIDGLEEKKVTPPEEVYERIKKENKLIAKARTVDTEFRFF